MLRDSQPSQPADNSQHHLTERPGAHAQYNTLARDVQNVAHRLESEKNSSGQYVGINAILDEVYGTALKGKSQEYQRTFANMLDMQLTADGTKGLVVDKFAAENFDFLSNGKKRITTDDLYGKADELGMMGRGLEKYLTEDVLIKSEQIRSSVKEHKFLGFGTKEGFDRRQLAKDEENEQTNVALTPTHRLPWQFGREDGDPMNTNVVQIKPVDTNTYPRIDGDGTPRINPFVMPLHPLEPVRPVQPVPTHPPTATDKWIPRATPATGPLDPTEFIKSPFITHPVEPPLPTHPICFPPISNPNEIPDRYTPSTSDFGAFVPLDLVGPAGAI